MEKRKLRRKCLKTPQLFEIYSDDEKYER